MLLDSAFFSSMCCPGRIHLFPQISKCLRRLDPFMGVMLTSGVCIVPGFLKCKELLSDKTNWKWLAWLLVSLLALLTLAIFGSAIAVVMIDRSEDEDRTYLAVLTPLGIFLTSFGWWQSFASIKKYQQKPTGKKGNTIIQEIRLYEIKLKVHDPKVYFFIGIILSLLKVLLFLGCLSIIPVRSGTVPGYDYIFQNFDQAFQASSTNITSPNGNVFEIRTKRYDGFVEKPWFILVLQLATTLFAYTSSRFACRLGEVRISKTLKFSFAAPAMTLVNPVSVVILVSLCNAYLSEGVCPFSSLPDTLLREQAKKIFFACPRFSWTLVGTGSVMSVGYFFITSHVWTAHSKVLATELQIFGRNYYCGLLVDQGMMLCRKSREEEEKEEEEKKGETETAMGRNSDAGAEQNEPFLDKTIRIRGWEGEKFTYER